MWHLCCSWYCPPSHPSRYLHPIYYWHVTLTTIPWDRDTSDWCLRYQQHSDHNLGVLNHRHGQQPLSGKIAPGDELFSCVYFPHNQTLFNVRKKKTENFFGPNYNSARHLPNADPGEKRKCLKNASLVSTTQLCILTLSRQPGQLLMSN